jgi:hypothetical protein
MVVHATIDRSAHESLLRSIRNGHSFKFWIDPWIDGACIAAFAPELFAAVAASRRRMRMVAQGLPNNAWIHDITRGLTVPVLIQYLELHQRPKALECLGQYSSSSTYAAL